ncbi:putative multidrug export ATP-binding/permease protein [Caloramator mitchellensis]|uniref:Putative multidrug export ATP-binding/permease protein n=1 Tax=Caloramator mitchellensis TaxID=908809 RepID=A0A0R3JRZ7_CALMK|nr:ABC transporter ATP-binding protein [Caloramator mitchellensis]KRQ86232.1 putative multidrug export ATP-binding/permease protein [Caloramator mitchellensis]
MIKQFAKYYKPHIGLFILDMVCAILISATDLVYPMITRRLINNIIPSKNLALIINIGIILFILYIIRMILEYIVGYYGHVLGVRMEYDMRKEMFSHMQTLPVSYFDNTKTGHIMSRMVNDLNEIAELAHHGPEDIFISTLMIIGAFFLLLNINVKLTLIVFTIIPFMVYFTVIYNSKMRRNFRKIRESLADVNSKLEDSISGIRVVKSFTNEEYEIDKFDEGNNMFKHLRTKSVKYIGILHGGINFFSNISTLSALIAGGYFVARGEIQVGDLVAYLIYISQFLQPVKRLAAFVEQYQRGMAGFKRFVEVMNIKPDIYDKEDAKDIEYVKGSVEFRNVTFSYDDKNTVLENINLKVEAGESVAIVGPSGVGKTTLCNLIPRFYEVDSGNIYVDGIDIKDITLKSLRKNIGIVQQDVFLFAGTIRENIAYGRLDAREDEIVKAAKAANAHDFIMEFEDGYDTYIGERGVKLSGGQKQRISIARMFLKNPPILILDEATSSLDNQSEAVIQKSIEELSKDRTTFIIAHRLATVKSAKRIIVLTENGIEEEGTHRELLERKGIYYELYKTQFE